MRSLDHTFVTLGLGVWLLMIPLGRSVSAQLPGTPSSERLEALLREHHTEALSNGLGEEERIWFIVDRDENVVHTGVGKGTGTEIAERLLARYPARTSDFSIGLRVDQRTGRIIPFGAPVEPDTAVLRVLWFPAP